MVSWQTAHKAEKLLIFPAALEILVRNSITGLPVLDSSEKVVGTLLHAVIWLYCC